MPADYDALTLSGGSTALPAGVRTTLAPNGLMYVETGVAADRTLVGHIYDQAGNPVGGSALLATQNGGTGPPIAYSTAPLTGGGWAAAWGDGGQGAYSGVAVLNSAGDLVNNVYLGSAFENLPVSVAPLSNGGFVAAWGAGGYYSYGNTYLETFAASGNPTSSLQTIGTRSSDPVVAQLGPGFVVAYGKDPDGPEVIASSAGGALGPAVALPANAHVDAMTALANGQVAVVFDTRLMTTTSGGATTTSGFSLSSQVFDPATNVFLGGPVQLDRVTATPGSPLPASPYDHVGVIATPDNGYVVSWPDTSYTNGYQAGRAVGPTGQAGPGMMVAGQLVGELNGSTAVAVANSGAGQSVQRYAIVAGSAPAETITANDRAGESLAGGAGNDVLFAGHNSAVLTGNGGADEFVFKYLPWNAGAVVDFAVGTDHLDLSELLRASGYTGNDPVSDGYVSLSSDGSGGTDIYYDTDGPAAGNTIKFLITDLKHVNPQGLTWSELSDGSTIGASGGSSGGGAGSGSGLILSGGDSARTLAGGAGNDTITAGHSSDTISTGGGQDLVAFKYVPWNASTVTDLTVGTDKADFSQLLSSQGYSGSDPVGAGYLSFVSDGHGGTDVMLNKDASGAVRSIPITVTDLQGVSPSGLTYAQLSGGASGGGGAGGQVLTSSRSGDTLVGGPGNDTLNAGQGPDTLTGNAGADHFVYPNLPWRAGEISDFTPGADKIDLSALASASGYHGSNPMADGYLSLASDGAGNTQVYWDADGRNTNPQWPTFITTVDHISPSLLGSGDFILS